MRCFEPGRYVVSVTREGWPTSRTPRGAASPANRVRLRPARSAVTRFALLGTVMMTNPWRGALRTWDDLPADVQAAVLVLAWVAGAVYGIRALVRHMFSPLDSDV